MLQTAKKPAQAKIMHVVAPDEATLLHRKELKNALRKVRDLIDAGSVKEIMVIMENKDGTVATIRNHGSSADPIRSIGMLELAKSQIFSDIPSEEEEI